MLSTFAVCQYRAVRKDRSIFEKRKRKKKESTKKKGKIEKKRKEHEESVYEEWTEYLFLDLNLIITLRLSLQIA